MSSVIIYGSNYGTTAAYANALAQKLGIPAISYKQVRNINQYQEIIYMGGLYAGGVCGMAKTLKKWNVTADSRICVVTVGLADPQKDENVQAIRKALTTQLSDELYRMAEVFHLRGGIDYGKLKPMHKMMMTLLYKKIARMPPEQQSEEMRALVETYNQNVSFVDETALAPIVEYWTSGEDKGGESV